MGIVAWTDGAAALAPLEERRKVNAMGPGEAGLCATCRHARIVETPRSRFLLCERSRTDASYARYPRLPMRACPGHEPPGGGDEPPGERPEPERERN
jgi:hypothetical protein